MITKTTPKPLGEEVTLEIRCEPDSRVLGSLRTMVTALATSHGFNEDQISQIEMAVDEACANVVRHAYKYNPDPDSVEMVIQVRIQLTPESMVISVIDFGVGLDSQEDKGARSVDEFLDRGAKGGLGLHIMQQFMDEVKYEKANKTGTCVVMTKYLQPIAQ